MMRTYDLDSPKAAARIVALTMLADGHISQAELSVLRERVLALCLSVAEADNSVSDGEALVLTYAVEQWGLQHRMLAAPANGLAA
jgi:uncharacterized tellurite resistance protein B-like protein